jgi:hypothetical protein
MVLSASQNPLSTTNPVGTKLERRSDCCMALIPPEKAPRESHTASNLSQSQNCMPNDSRMPSLQDASSLPRDAIRRPRDTPIWKLEASR